MGSKLFGLILGLMFGITAYAQVETIIGDWATVDDRTGDKRAIVTIYKGSDGLYYGKIARLIVGDPAWKCVACTDEDKNAPIVGLVILRGMKYDKDDNCLYSGKVLDPESGKFYYGKIYPRNGKLVLRGSVDRLGLFGRNQTWVRP